MSCIVCRHPEHSAIDAALIEGVPGRQGAMRFGLKKSTLFAHRSKCVAGALSEAIRRERTAAGDSLLLKLDFLLEKTLAVISRCERGKRADSLLLRAVDASVGILKLRASLTGVKTPEAPRVNYHVIFERGRPQAVEIPPAIEAAADEVTDHAAE